MLKDVTNTVINSKHLKQQHKNKKKKSFIKSLQSFEESQKLSESLKFPFHSKSPNAYQIINTMPTNQKLYFSQIAKNKINNISNINNTFSSGNTLKHKNKISNTLDNFSTNFSSNRKSSNLYDNNYSNLSTSIKNFSKNLTLNNSNNYNINFNNNNNDKYNHLKILTEINDNIVNPIKIEKKKP
jgi:hypothetical protein